MCQPGKHPGRRRVGIGWSRQEDFRDHALHRDSPRRHGRQHFGPRQASGVEWPFAIEDGGVVETAAKTIPILLQTVDLTMYPEGGELVPGLPNRVYLAALTPAQKPADIAGTIVDAAGKTVTEFRTEHEGRGRFHFTPKAGDAYTLKITEPAGIKTTYPLPE